MTSVEAVAAAVLYEGYILWPYRRSAAKNQQRWTIGGVYPRAFCETTAQSDPWRMQTQCIVVGRDPVVAARVRFLHVVERRVARYQADGSLDFVDELRAGDQRYLAWDEAREREVCVSDVRLSDVREPRCVPISVAADGETEAVPGGVLLRTWRALEGALAVRAELVEEDVWRLSVSVSNTSRWQGEDRATTARYTFVSTHTILTVRDGEFISLMDPPPSLKLAADACENVKTWPVLAGEEGNPHTVLSSPIILYDYPRIAPESRGDLFDSGEIDQLLALNILTLTDEEKDEMRATDPRVRRILERTEALTADDFMTLHGAIRDLQVLRDDDDAPVPTTIDVNGVEVTRGSRVRLRPRGRGDVMDLVLADKMAIVDSIEQDYEDRLHLAVLVEDDPGRDIGESHMVGHRFFFSPDEVEPLR